MENNYKYSEITSFKDLQAGKERLRLKGKLAEARLSLDFLQIKRAFSFSALFSSLAREIAFPKISQFLSTLIKKSRKED
jgi:hypothetical protein